MRNVSTSSVHPANCLDQWGCVSLRGRDQEGGGDVVGHGGGYHSRDDSLEDDSRVLVPDLKVSSELMAEGLGCWVHSGHGTVGLAYKGPKVDDDSPPLAEHAGQDHVHHDGGSATVDINSLLHISSGQTIKCFVRKINSSSVDKNTNIKVFDGSFDSIKTFHVVWEIRYKSSHFDWILLLNGYLNIFQSSLKLKI